MQLSLVTKHEKREVRENFITTSKMMGLSGRKLIAAFHRTFPQSNPVPPPDPSEDKILLLDRNTDAACLIKLDGRAIVY